MNSLRSSLSGTSLLFLTASLLHRLNNLPVATKCAVLNAVSTIILIFSFVNCAPFTALSLICNALLQLEVLEYLKMC